MARPRKPGRKNWPPNLYVKPDGYFYFRDPRNGRTLGLGRDKAYAMREARAGNAVLASLAAPKPIITIVGKTRFTLADWLRVYLPLWIEEQKPSTAALTAARVHLAEIATATFASRRLSTITTRQVLDFIMAVERKIGPRGAGMVRARLRDVFRLAEVNGLIKRGGNPLSDAYP